MKKTPLVAVIAIALVILVGGTYDSNAYETASISIDGMRCGGCTSKVETVLSGKAGVRTVSVDLETSLATVEYYPSKVDQAELVAAVAGAGFTAAACDLSKKKAEGASCNTKKAKTASTGASCGTKDKKTAI